MGYPIIFKTKIVKLEDGRLIHFDLSGCNNDNEGRRPDDWHGRVFTESEFHDYAESFKKNSKPYKESDGFTMKIGSRYCTEYDYGEHLLRMKKKAITWKELCSKYSVSVSLVESVEVYKGLSIKPLIMTPDEFEEYLRENYLKNIVYHIVESKVSDEKQVVEALENSKMARSCICIR